jgi:LPXTG-site transpeptidase (sortase) family protein
MALYNYQKTKTARNFQRPSDEFLLKDFKVKKSIVRQILDIPLGVYSDLVSVMKKSSVANLVIPIVFIGLGGAFIYKEFFPDIQAALKTSNGYLAQGNVSPVSEQYLNIENYISKPLGFKELTIEALNEHTLETDTKSLDYNGVFYLTVPSIGINRLPVQSNVDSTTESVYNQVLLTKLAHFKSTGLPISDIKNNMLIYGHSASPNYNPNPSDPEVAFSFLPDLKVGDEITIEMEGQEYKYIMSSSKIVKPTDTSVITGVKGRKTLTLVTCFPLGSNENRYVAVARPV